MLAACEVAPQRHAVVLRRRAAEEARAPQVARGQVVPEERGLVLQCLMSVWARWARVGGWMVLRLCWRDFEEMRPLRQAGVVVNAVGQHGAGLDLCHNIWI